MKQIYLVLTLLFICGIVNSQTNISEKKLKELKKTYFIEGSRELSVNSLGQLLLVQRTKKPICYNNFSFLTGEEIKKNEFMSLINLNTNVLAIEVIPFFFDDNGGFIVDGNYRLFKHSTTLSDTSCLWASYHFKNDLREGIAEIWDAEKNGKAGIAPFIKMNFFNDKLHGYSEMFYPDGKVAVSAEFKKGYVDGEVIAYNFPPDHNPFEPNYHVKAWVHSGGVLSIHQIGDFKETIYENINTIKKNGGTCEAL